MPDSKVISMAAKAAGMLLGTRDVGSRYADRVTVRTPQGSYYDGRKGIVERVQGDTVFVRLQVGDTHSMTLPFAPGELEVSR